MTAEQYVTEALRKGTLTSADIVDLTRFFQADMSDLAVDGKPGPKTLAALRELYTRQFVFDCWPMLNLPDGRVPVITSGFGPRGKNQKQHNGVDLFYYFKAGDEPSFVGDGGAARGSDGKPRWVVPYNTDAIAVAAGRVTAAGPTATGHRVWIDHGNGWRSGYFHLDNLWVHPGDPVQVGEPLGRVGDNPIDHDARHLHFEVSPTDRYAPVDPRPFLP
jgi:murein DD-endopeptidase MepM/ murein hydrolase activator NlpD